MEMKNMIQIRAEKLADICLDEGEIYHGYENRDLVNATLIFSHFFMDTIYRENQNLSLKDQCELAKTSGEALRELINISTGLDMHKLVKE